MNDNITSTEDLIQELEAQDLEGFESALELLRVSYVEYTENKTKELKGIYSEAVFDLKTLLQDYAGEDASLVEETYEELFNEMKEEL